MSGKLKFRIRAILLVLLGWFLLESSVTIYQGVNDTMGSADYAVVLGSKVHENGELSERLKARVDQGLKLYQDSLVQKVLVSGGRGKEGHNEAIKMAEYLIAQGVPAPDVVMDTLGNTTYLTAKNSTELIPDFKTKRVIVVSQFFHLRRTEIIFERMGFEQVYRSHARHFELRDLYGLFREFFAVYKYRFMKLE
ncbi:YdcF family protein [bacterium SCSIO 12741]|nr:YdcF family protein [bacterium SCSIO 12741]